MNEIKKRYISFVLLFVMIFATFLNYFSPKTSSTDEINKQRIVREELGY